MLWFYIPNISDPKERCRTCAGEPVPDPFPVDDDDASRPPLGLGSIAQMALSWKDRQGGV